MQDTLSVVVPAYNVEDYLGRCIESILNQTFPVMELIVVDDGSTDRTGQIADEYAGRDARVRVLHQKNGGLSAARNTGLDAASAEYIGFVDSDDYIEPRMYEELLALLHRHSADMAVGGVWYETEDGEKYSPYPPNVQRVWEKRRSLLELNSYRYFNMSFCDTVFRRSLFEETAYGEGTLRFPVGKLCEDYYLMHRVVARIDRMAYTSQPYYHYVQRQNSISRNTKINLAPMDASMAQLRFYEAWFPELAYAARTACFFSHMDIYTTYCRRGQTCPEQLVKQIRTVCRRYYPSVLRSRHIPAIKQAQAALFLCAQPLYARLVKNTKHR